MIRAIETLENRRMLASINVIDSADGNSQYVEINGSNRADDMEIVKQTKTVNGQKFVQLKIWHNGKTQKANILSQPHQPIKDVIVNGFANRDTILVIDNDVNSGPVVTVNGDGDHDALEARGGRMITLNGGESSDSLIAVKAPIPVDGDPSFVLIGGPGNDAVVGSNAKDFIDATEGNDWAYAGDGDDTIVYDNDADIQGGFGNDRIYAYYEAGNMGSARIDGEWGLDTLTFLTDDPNVTVDQAFEGVFTTSIEMRNLSDVLII